MGPTLTERPKLEKIPEPPAMTNPELGNPEASNLTPQSQLAVESSTAEQPKRPPGRPIDPNSQRQQKLNNPKPTTTKEPKGNIGPPSFSEWQSFLGEVVIHWLCYAIVSVSLRGVDRANLTIEEREDIELDDEEEAAIAKPLANMILNSKFNGKYGRAILNMRDGIEAVVILFFFASRVNRIGRKYRPKHSRQLISRSGVERPQNVTDLRAARIERPRDIEQEASEAPSPPIWNGHASAANAPGFGFN